MRILRWYLRKLAQWDRGTVAVTFLLSLPILLLVIGIFAQYALIANAKITLNRALDAAARAAITALPTDPAVDKMDGVSYVNKAARMVLVSLSPAATDSTSVEALEVTQALQTLGVDLTPNYAQRYTYAEAATTVDYKRLDDTGQVIDEPQWQPADFAKHPGQRIQITVTYQFRLTVPLMTVTGFKNLIGNNTTVAGVNGTFLTMQSTEIVQLSHGREATTGGDGWPQ